MLIIKRLWLIYSPQFNQYKIKVLLQLRQRMCGIFGTKRIQNAPTAPCRNCKYIHKNCKRFTGCQVIQENTYPVHFTFLDVWLCCISTLNQFCIMVSILWMTSSICTYHQKHPQMRYYTVADTIANYAFRIGIALACKYPECLHEVVSLLDAALSHIALAKAFLSLYIRGLLSKTQRQNKP